MCTVEPLLIKDTLNKGHLCIKDTFQCTNLYSGNTFFASERGQPLYNGQNDPSQCVDVPLYVWTVYIHLYVQAGGHVTETSPAPSVSKTPRRPGPGGHKGELTERIDQLTVVSSNNQTVMETHVHTVEPLIKDTLNKGHLCIKANAPSGNTFLPLKEDNLSIMDKMSCVYPLFRGSTVAH